MLDAAVQSSLPGSGLLHSPSSIHRPLCNADAVPQVKRQAAAARLGEATARQEQLCKQLAHAVELRSQGESLQVCQEPQSIHDYQ